MERMTVLHPWEERHPTSGTVIWFTRRRHFHLRIVDKAAIDHSFADKRSWGIFQRVTCSALLLIASEFSLHYLKPVRDEVEMRDRVLFRVTDARKKLCSVKRDVLDEDIGWARKELPRPCTRTVGCNSQLYNLLYPCF